MVRFPPFEGGLGMIKLILQIARWSKSFGGDPPKSLLKRGTSGRWLGSLLFKEG
jgi:hypothetical protein